MDNLKRGTVKIKPVYVGIHHYRDVYGSVCSADVVGTPRINAPEIRDLKKKAKEMIDEFEKNIKVNFVEIGDPLIIKEHKDLRRVPAELSYDVDALPWAPAFGT